MDLRDNIAARMEELGMNPNSTAVEAGLPRDAVRDILAGKSQHPRVDTVAKIAKALGTTIDRLLEVPEQSVKRAEPLSDDLRMQELPIRFEVAAGAWLAQEDYGDGSHGTEWAARVKPYEAFPQWLERVRGDSVNMLIPDGALAHVVDSIAMGYEARHGDLVVVERRRAQGAFIERTIKQVVINAGQIELWPRSFNPKWAAPILPTEGLRDGEEAEVEIKGLVIRAYMPFLGRDG